MRIKSIGSPVHFFEEEDPLPIIVVQGKLPESLPTGRLTVFEENAPWLITYVDNSMETVMLPKSGNRQSVERKLERRLKAHYAMNGAYEELIKHLEANGG